jgi:hypothetical protein
MSACATKAIHFGWYDRLEGEVTGNTSRSIGRDVVTKKGKLSVLDLKSGIL